MQLESGDGARGTFTDQFDIVLRTRPGDIVVGRAARVEGRAQQDMTVRPIGKAKRAAAAGLVGAEQREFGLCEQLEQIGARAFQLDLDHLGGAGDDLVDRAEEGQKLVA